MTLSLGGLSFVIILVASFICFHNVDSTFLKPTKATTHGALRLYKVLKQKNHSKRGLYSGVPTFSAGYDFPIVRHSYLKPLVLDYPAPEIPIGVKIPLKPPIAEFNFPLPVGHQVPVPHPHYGLRFPQNHLHIVPSVPLHNELKPAPHPIHFPGPKPVVHIEPVIPQIPDHQYSPQLFPIPQHQHVTVSNPPLIHFPSPPFNFPPEPFVPVHAQQFYPVQPEPPVPVAPLAPPIIRPGNQLVSSFFATYPKYPFVNFGGLGYPPLLGQIPINENGRPLIFQRPDIQPNLIPVNNGNPTFYPGIDSGQAGVDQQTRIDTQQTNTNTNTDEAWRPVINPTSQSHPTTTAENPQLVPTYGYPSQDSGVNYQHNPQIPVYENNDQGNQGHHYYNTQIKQNDQGQQDNNQVYQHGYDTSYDQQQNSYGDSQQEQQIPQTIPDHRLSGRPITEGFRNHIPLGLQPPITRPSEDFHGYQ